MSVTKWDLQNYIALRMENEHHLERIARMKAAESMPAMREGDGSQHSGSAGDAMARRIERRMKEEERVAPLIAQNIRVLQRVEAAINAIANPLEREVLRMRYLRGDGCRQTRWNDIAIALYGDDDQKYMDAVFRLHRMAIQNFLKVSQ